jgi:hypothetical protein
MGRGYRFTLLGLEAIVTIALSLALIQGISLSYGQANWPLVRAHFIESLIHLWITMGVATLLCLFYRANIGAEARLLPILFLMITLSNAKILPLYQTLSTHTLLSPSAISVLYHFAILYSSFLFLASAIFAQTINPTKLGQYAFAGGALSLLLAILVPVSTGEPSFAYTVSVTNPLFNGICLFIYILALFTFIIAMMEEFTRQALGRTLSFVLMILGTMMMTIYTAPFTNTAGLIFYIGGTTALILVTRTYHIWT